MISGWWKKGVIMLLASGLLLTACGSTEETAGTGSKPAGGTEQTGGPAAGEARYALDPNTPAWQLDSQEMTELT